MIHLTSYAANDATFAVNPAHIVALFRNINHPEYTDIVTVSGEFTAREDYDTVTAKLAGKEPVDLLPPLELLVRTIEEWPSLHKEGDYLHGYPLITAKNAIAHAKAKGQGGE